MKNPFRYFNRSPEIIRLTVRLRLNRFDVCRWDPEAPWQTVVNRDRPTSILRSCRWSQSLRCLGRAATAGHL